ncbi:ankyrin repeat domain-containing protein [Aspergillus ibericus CBS 121593]|uniref:Ankyrin n=1 Tax=Aspergillus ibericus CBS 121593 TaxID=1448316 RepID=A0A395GK93_9EURO|nr:ankyrin [Aspergillus ibericus CBS 121593]RAK95217.1 ankyrin [Aspergillus ibericus CBS 121593]
MAREDYSDLPIVDPKDLVWTGLSFAPATPFECACRAGPLSAVEALVAERTCTPAFLHRGLTFALSAGNEDITRSLLVAGAPIVQRTALNILRAPSERQLPLFQLLSLHGWSPQGLWDDGSLLTVGVITNPPLLRWFLDQGVDPNAGALDLHRRSALELAAGRGDVDTVRLLVEAGADVQQGLPLHVAAAACPSGTDADRTLITPTEEFDTARIPVMALLVAHGANVNQPQDCRLMTPRYAIVYAVIAGAVARVRWLLAHGADPEAKGALGSAWDYAQRRGSEEMRRVLAEGVAAKRRLQASHAGVET